MTKGSAEVKVAKIYFLRRKDGLIKIGYTANLKRRLEHLTKSHGALEIVRLINGDKHREKRLHGDFRAFNQFGEWFRDCAELRAAITALSDGSVVEVTAGCVERDWVAGEAAMAAEAAVLVDRLIQTRRQRFGVKNNAAMAGISADHGIGLWFLRNLQAKRPNTVSAFGFKKLREALIAEMTAYRDELQAVLNEEDSDKAA